MTGEDVDTYAIVVDDDPECREDVRNVFPIGRLKECREYTSQSDFETKFLSRIRGKRHRDMPGVVFLDIRMEAEDSGLQLLRKIRRRKRLKRTPVIVISQSAENEDIAQSYDCGASLYLVKGEDPTVLPNAVRAIVTTISQCGRIPTDIAAFLEGR